MHSKSISICFGRGFLLVSLLALAFGCTKLRSSVETKAVSAALPVSEVAWEQLNPARGDRSPQAGTLWGDRLGPGPAGFLLKPVDGFRSPPHIHNVSYRGVVIRDLIHNDDPSAPDLWMPTSSFWTQPAGGVHITASKGERSLAYIEVEDSFGVLPAKDAFSSEENPINVHSSNLVWVDLPGAQSMLHGAKIAYLWGTPDHESVSGALLRLPTESTGRLKSIGLGLRVVTIQGIHTFHVGESGEAQTLDPGSYLELTGGASRSIGCRAGIDCILYVRSQGGFALLGE